MLSPDRYHLVPVATWQDFFSWHTALLQEPSSAGRRWIFRGERNPSNDLTTTLEREALRCEISFGDLHRVEGQLVNEFRRRAHHYVSDVPARHDLVEWLALMQHYGAPTRLLDWSYSLLVAAYFAIEKADQDKCIIWGMESLNYTSPITIEALGAARVNRHYSENVEPKLLIPPEETKRRLMAIVHFLFDVPHRGLFVVNPFRLSERATIQQSAHVMPGDMSLSFEDNLNAHGREHDNLTRMEIVSSPKVRKEFLVNLHRMNINRATLFPGLQGLAESMNTRLTHPELLSV